MNILRGIEMKVMTVVGTRPEIIKLSCVIEQLDRYTSHTLVHTGQNYDYELNGIFFENMEIRKPDIFLEAAASTPSETIANIIQKSDELFRKNMPDAILLYGDTNSCLSVIPAKRNKIPVFHMEAGNRCFDQRVPEELNRKIVDHLSDINMTLTEHARRYLIREGIRPETIFKVGSSMKEVFRRQRASIEACDVLEKLNLHPREYFVVSAHREENTDYSENFNNLIESLNAIADKYGKRIIFSTHPRTAKLLKKERREVSSLVEFLKPLGFAEYVKLQLNAACVISDSGTITEESSILKFPAVTIRNAHERPEGMDEGALIMCGLKKDRVMEAIDTVMNQYTSSTGFPEIVPDYDVENVSDKVVRIILSYTDYINRTVWGK